MLLHLHSNLTGERKTMKPTKKSQTVEERISAHLLLRLRCQRMHAKQKGQTPDDATAQIHRESLKTLATVSRLATASGRVAPENRIAGA